jgi:hypothetical protein
LDEYESRQAGSRAHRCCWPSGETRRGAKKEADLKPHCLRYWLTLKPDPAFDRKCADIYAVYKAAAGADDTHRTISIDEMTGKYGATRCRRCPGL